MIDPKDDRDKFGRGSGPAKRGPDLRAGDDPRWASLRYDGSPGISEVGLKDRAQRLGWPTIGLELKRPKAKPKPKPVNPSAASCTCQCRCDEATVPAEEGTTAPADEVAAPAEEVAAPFDEATAPADGTTAPSDEAAASFDEATAPADGATVPDEEVAGAAGWGREAAVVGAGDSGGGGLVGLDPFTLDGDKTGEQVLA